VINGSMIEAREVKESSPDGIMKYRKKNQMRDVMGNIEETKINFFDPSQANERLTL